MYSGGCLCNTVRFEIHGDIRNIVYCHCSQCRKAQGTAFATNGIVQTKDFIFLNGENDLTGFTVNEKQIKYFCKHCGSPIMSKNTDRPEQIRVRLGTIESDIHERPEAHIFASSKANWDQICDDIPQFDEFEPAPR